MLNNVRKLFKNRGASSPSSKDRSSFNENSGSRGHDSVSRGRSGTDSNRDFGPYHLKGHSGSNGHCSSRHSTVPPEGMGLPTHRSNPTSPRKQNGRHGTDPKLLQLLGATEDELDEVKWNFHSSPKGNVGNDFFRSQNGYFDEGDSSPDMEAEPWPQKSELPPSFEFARPTGKDEQQDMTDKFFYLDTGASSSPNRPEPFPFGQANRSYGEESSMENGTATASGEDSSVDSLDALHKAVRPAPPLYASRPSSPRPSNGYSSPRGPPSPRGSASPRGSSHSPDGRSWGSNGNPNGRLEGGMSWGSTGSASPKWAYSGQPSPLHPLPAPPATANGQPHLHSPLTINPGRGPSWIEVSNSGAVPGQASSPRVFSPSHPRVSTRMPSHLSPVVSPHPSPPRSPTPRSPMRRPQPSFPPGSWSPLPPPPPMQCQSPPRSPTRPPKKLTKWRKIKQIGTGSFGTVHEAINLEDGSFFAVKVSHDESIPAEIQKEVEVLSMLRHQNVVQYFGTAMEDGHLCIFLELMQSSLQSIIKVFHPFDETLISTYTRQILQGLEYLHRKNTIHRDIKCANILVDKDGQVKLADFGLAKEVANALATSCKGTPYFMAPEILKPHSNEKRGYGLPVDIWSLGCTVLEMADGQPPWSFLQGYSFFFKLNKGELPPIPQHLSNACQDFIKTCLQFRPEDRPTASQLLLHPFVANAPATADAAAFVSSSGAAMFMGSLVDGSEGIINDVRQSRNGLIADVQGYDLPHHRPALLRSPRFNKSANISYGNPQFDLRQSQETVHYSPCSPSSDVSSNFIGRHHG